MQPQKKPKGCFFWGCLTALILLLAVGGCTGFFIWKFKNILMSISDDKPIDVPTIDVTPEELSALDERISEFARQADQGGGGELVLSAEDLNRRIVGANEGLKGQLWARIEGDQMLLDASLPLGEHPQFGQIPIGFEDRYLNGTLSARLTLEDGMVGVTIDTITIDHGDGDEPNEENVQLASQLMNEWILTDPRVRYDIDAFFGAAAKKAKSLEIKDGKLIFRN
jgi:hypothetical protein